MFIFYQLMLLRYVNMEPLIFILKVLMRSFDFNTHGLSLLQFFGSYNQGPGHKNTSDASATGVTLKKLCDVFLPF